MILLLGSFDAAEYAEWRRHLAMHLPAKETLIASGDAHDADAVDIALVANPPHGALARYRNLRFVQSLWAGVEKLLADPELPEGVTIARLIDPDLTQAMVEGVLGHVMALHRQTPAYARAQTQGQWRPLSQPFARERRVGVLGLGQLGKACAEALRGVGFDVAGWSLRPKQVDGVRCYHGPDGLHALLERTDILVNLLPLTSETQNILDRALFARLPRGACLVNVARGAHLNEDDLLAALDSGQIGHAILDVFRSEPLPPGHPFWQHPAVSVFPHIAATTSAASAAVIAAANVRAFRTGAALTGLVSRKQGY